MTHNEITTKDYEIDYSNPLSEWIGKTIIWLREQKTCKFVRPTVKLIAVCKDCMIVERTMFEGFKYLGIYPYHDQVKLGEKFVKDLNGWALYEENYPGPERDPEYLYLILTNRI